MRSVPLGTTRESGRMYAIAFVKMHMVRRRYDPGDSQSGTLSIRVQRHNCISLYWHPSSRVHSCWQSCLKIKGGRLQWRSNRLLLSDNTPNGRALNQKPNHCGITKSSNDGRDGKRQTKVRRVPYHPLHRSFDHETEARRCLAQPCAGTTPAPSKRAQWQQRAILRQCQEAHQRLSSYNTPRQEECQWLEWGNIPQTRSMTGV